MCHHYYFDHPACQHVSTEYYAPCAAATQRGGEPCDLPSNSEPEAVVRDEPCEECLGSGRSSSNDGREGLSAILERGESEYGSRSHTGRPTAGARSVASDARRSHAGDDWHPEQPHQNAPEATRWPSQDDTYEDGRTASRLHSVTSSRSDNTLRQQPTSPNSPYDYREAELETAKVEAALRTSVLTANIDEEQMIEYARQLSLHEVPISAHMLEQTEYAKQMRLPEDDDTFLHEAKKESIRTLTEQQLKQYELRHATIGSPSRPDSRAAGSSTSRAGPSRAAHSPHGFASAAQPGAYQASSTPSDEYWQRPHIAPPADHLPPQRQPQPLHQQRPSQQFTTDFPTRGVVGGGRSSASSQASYYEYDDESDRAGAPAHQ